MAIAEFENFRKAAEACAVAQPSLSAQVAQLEAALGVTIFERSARGVTVTRVPRAYPRSRKWWPAARASRFCRKSRCEPRTAYAGNSEAFTYLLERGADPNSVDGAGNSVLIGAAFKGARDFAKNFGRTEVLNLLLNAEVSS